MRIIMIGCEYAGKTTLTAEISRWLERNLGRPQFGQYMWHDHFVFPFAEGEGEQVETETAHILAMPPSLLEKYSRYMIHYHLVFYQDSHHLVVNWYYGDAVYAPLYYGYGEPDGYADRGLMARSYDAKVMQEAPDSVLILVKASPDVIRRRMAQGPRPQCPLQEQDVELVLQRFEEEFKRSGIRRRFTLDTSSATVAETLQTFVKEMEPHLTADDRLAMLTHRRA
jgi:hypothetical protein